MPKPRAKKRPMKPVAVSIVMSDKNEDLIPYTTTRGSSLQQQFIQSQSRARKAEESNTDLQKEIDHLKAQLATAETEVIEANEREEYYRQELKRVDNAYNTVLESMHALKLRYKREMTNIHALVQGARTEWTREKHRSSPPPREIVGLSRQIVSLANELQGLLREMGNAADEEVVFCPKKRTEHDDVNARLKEIARVAYAFSNKTICDRAQAEKKTSAPPPKSAPLTARLINMQTGSATLV